jgi:hypothetical protein
MATSSRRTLLPDAQYCYSQAIMKTALRAFLAASMALVACLPCIAAGGAGVPDATQRPREIYEALNALQVDAAQIYAVSEIRLRRDDVSLIFSDGILGFLQAYDGRVTGVVFSGSGHVSANLRDPSEKQSLVHFLGVPLLDQGFSRAYLRFNDGSADEILNQLRRSGVSPMEAGDFARTWDKSIANLNPDQSIRLLVDWMAETPVPYFYAELLDERLGAFDVVVDGRSTDTVMIGQDRWAGGNHFYDVWTSFAGSNAPAAPPPAFVPVSYAINTTIDNDKTLEGTTTIELRADGSGERAIALELSRYLTVQSAQDADGRTLDFFRDASLVRTHMFERGDNRVVVFLAEPPRADQTYRIRLTYRGGVISDAGNGVYFVGGRGSWYPHVGGMSHFAQFDTTFRWPRKLRLVATGQKVEEREEGDRRIGHWKSEGPSALAGFNLGDYVFEKIDEVNGIKIEVAADSSLEKPFAGRGSTQADMGLETRGQLRPRRSQRNPIIFDDAPEVPAGPLRDLGHQIAEAIRFEQQWMGPFPFHQLEVSQVPAPYGQGFPGLLYLPSPSFIPATAQERMGISSDAQQSLNEIIPYHEVAHQWWGNVVGWDNYRDQWIHEALANYIALAGADAEKPGAHLLTQWLDRYRKDLTSPISGQENTVDDAGPLVHGIRLNSSHDPDAYEKIVYGKGAWIFHMLRIMLQDPPAKNPDERFIGLLHGLLESHRYRALTTADLQKAVEHVMTPAMDIEGGRSMDWFFEQFVRSTGVPVYDVEFSVRPGPKGFLVRGKLIQKNVPEDFALRVPIYGQPQGSKPALLGHVVTSGDETSFEFVSATSPRRLLIDPQLTLLCVSSASSSPLPD